MKDTAVGYNPDNKSLTQGQLIGIGVFLNIKEKLLITKPTLQAKTDWFIVCDIVKQHKITLLDLSNKSTLWFNLIHNQISNWMKLG